MNAGHSPEPSAHGMSGERDLWARLMAGELDLDDPKVAEEFASDPQLAEKYSQLKRLETHMDRVAREERELLQVATGPDAGRGGLELDLGPPEELQGSLITPPAGLFGGRKFGSLLALAAAALVAWFLLGHGQPASNPLDLEGLRGRLLAESDFRVWIEMRSSGPVLRWDVDPELGWFDLAVFEIAPETDPQAVDLGTPIYEARDMFDNRVDLSTTPWPTSDNALWVRITQRIEGATGRPKSGGLLLPPGPLASSH